MRLSKLLAVCLLATLPFAGSAKKKSVDPADQPRAFVQLLWPEGAPHPKEIKPDVNGNLRKPVDVGDTAKIYAFLPAPSKANGRAIVLCPGGAYLGLCMSYEGGDWAQFYNDLGIALFVLQYRIPEGDKRLPMEDVQEAIRLVRRNAVQWGVDPDKVGVGGSSAGGHLASTASTHFNTPVNPDSISCRPDFAVLYYPVISFTPELAHTETRRNFLGPNFNTADELLYSNELQVTPETPTTWIGFSHDDSGVSTINGIRYYEALKKAGVPAALHIYPSGEHGWGFLPNFKYRETMLEDLSSFLNTL